MHKINNRLCRLRKLHMILLEIMIALALITLCIFPLIGPRAVILKEQNKLIETIQLDHLVSLAYVDVLERLQKNEIPWNDIKEHTVLPIDEPLLHRIGDLHLPHGWKGTYRFDDLKHVENEATGWAKYLLLLTFVVKADEAPLEKNKRVFQYSICALRHALIAETTPQETKKEEPQKRLRKN